MIKINQKDIFEISNILKVLSNPERIEILCYLEKDKKDVTSIVKNVDAPQSTVSNHLAVLKKHWIIEWKRDSRKIIYKISDKKYIKLVKKLKDILT